MLFGTIIIRPDMQEFIAKSAVVNSATDLLKLTEIKLKANFSANGFCFNVMQIDRN